MARPSVAVRMYKGLLGDCFLLRIRRSEDGQDESAHILIDCGMLQGVKGDREIMARVAADIARETGNHLDLVVVTHEHWDHISGFAHAQDFFLEEGGVSIGRLWLAWTERMGDDLADRLRGTLAKSKAAIVTSVQRMRSMATHGGAASEDPDEPWVSEGLAGLEGFIGPVDEPGSLGAQQRWTGARIIQRLKERAGEDSVDYLEPGEVRTTPGPVGITAYVLGPPRREDRLFKDLPSRGDEKETYLNQHLAAREREAESVERNHRGCSESDPFGDVPFTRRHRVIGDWLIKNGLGAPDPEDAPRLTGLRQVSDRYSDPGERWRRIDSDWGGVAAQLALKLDSDTNNTSLVLAFELEPGGDVLLFAADAQVGNWLSWHDQDYAVPGSDREVPATDLLRRTVLYKVGHHASHNATLSKQGLELMTSDRLVAMIPVVNEIASKRKGWHMPFPPLLERLLKLTKGRVIRGDEDLPEDLLEQQPAFTKRVTTRPVGHDGICYSKDLWVELEL